MMKACARTAFVGLSLLILAACTGGGGTRETLNFGASAPPYALLFASYDEDGNGVTDALEFDKGASASWAFASGGEGAVRALGFQDWAERAVGSRDVAPGFLTFDANRDDRLERGEFEAGLARIFEGLDQNGDGALARAEMLNEALPLGPDGALPRRDIRVRPRSARSVS